MENTVHEHAVATLKAAKDRVVLLIGKPPPDASPFHTLSSGWSSMHVMYLSRNHTRGITLHIKKTRILYSTDKK